jgi:hypothetical protein
MGKELFPHYNEIPWGKIHEVRISSDGGAYLFEFEIAGKKQLMTISITGGQTSFTLSKAGGSPIVHATQKGREIRVLDFSNKLRLQSSGSALKGLHISKKKPAN